MASNFQTVKVFLTSHADDFSKERDILTSEILEDLKAWGETKRLNVTCTDIKWGKENPDNFASVLHDISSAYYHGEMPFFINIASESIGLVPMWGTASDDVIEDYRTRLKVSLSDMEILYSAYREDNENTLFVVRKDGFLKDLVSDHGKNYFIDHETLSPTEQMVVRSYLKLYPEKQVYRYKYECAGWDSIQETMRIEFNRSFSSTILKFMKDRILQIFNIPKEVAVADTYQSMKDAQEVFMKVRSPKVKGREDLIAKIHDYILFGEKETPLLLLGGAGCGKSSIMLKATNQLVDKKENEGLRGGGENDWHLFYHFVGAVPTSTDLHHMLKRLLRELSIVHDSFMPKDLDSTAQICCSALSNPSTKPVIILVDAINQFDEDTAALLMSWVPRKLAPKVKCVFSMINDTHQHKVLMRRESKAEELHLTPLDYSSRLMIVEELLHQYNKKLTSNQMETLLSKQSSENPLWLSIACEQLRHMNTPYEMNGRIASLANGLLELLEEVLQQLEAHSAGRLIIGTLCLLETSATGLLESELLSMLADDNLSPDTIYDEKDEKESSEKEGSEKIKKKGCILEDQWAIVYRSLRSFLRPYGDSREGRLDFYHRALSKAVRRKYFKTGEENEDNQQSADLYLFWHTKLADFFENCDSIDRKAEEYLYHLTKMDDRLRLTQCLKEWSMFDKLYNEEFSTLLLSFWRKVGGAPEMIVQYKEALIELEETEKNNEELIALRYENVAKVFVQAGKYNESLELTKVALKMEEKELGNRPERMVELYGLMAEIYDEKLKLNDFVSPTQLPDLRKTISYGRKSIAIRKTFTGDYHKFKLGLSLMKLAFSLESWEACGGDGEMSGVEALNEGNKHIDTAMKIFQELNDSGHYAEALMTKGVLAERGSAEQLKYYNEAMEISMQLYGEYHLLTSRLYINIGIVYEDNHDYVRAFEYFRKWAHVSEVVLGPDHPKTLRARGVLKEPRYILVALRIKDSDTDSNSSPESPLDEIAINQEVGELDDFNEDLEEEEDITERLEVDLQDNSQNAASLVIAAQELRQTINDLLQRAAEGINVMDLDNRNEDEHWGGSSDDNQNN